MHPRLFRLLEKNQRIDALLRLVEQGWTTSQLEIERLRRIRLEVKRLI